jgi:hypothetical protein
MRINKNFLEEFHLIFFLWYIYKKFQFFTNLIDSNVWRWLWWIWRIRRNARIR